MDAAINLHVEEKTGKDVPEMFVRFKSTVQDVSVLLNREEAATLEAALSAFRFNNQKKGEQHGKD